MKRIVALTVAALGAGAGQAAAQNYGVNVAATDNVVFVAEARSTARPGIVYAYRQGTDGKWSEFAKLMAPNSAKSDRFGNALAASGNMLIVGHASAGAAYIFERSGDTWQQVARLAPPDAAAADSVGGAVAIGGDVALVGAPGGNGAVYVFRRGASGWTQEAKLTGSDAKAGDGFGRALAASPTRVAVGAPQQEKARGAIYIFDNAGGQWTETAKAVARTVKEGDLLGATMALYNQDVIASAPGRDEATGAVYIFSRNPNAPGYAAFTRLFPYEATSNTQFGASINLVGNELWLGAPGADGFGGAVFRYRWDAAKNDWTGVSKLSLQGVAPGTGYSAAFAVAGNTAIAGLPGDDGGEGTAMVIARAGSGEWEQRNKVFSETESFAAVTGKPVDCVNDVAADFKCSNIELQGFLPIKDIGGERGVNLNDIWGWTDPSSGKEYALVGRTNGTSFVDVSDASNPKYLGDLPMTTGARANAWRDIKVYKNHAYIVADGAGNHGMQVFDLTRLRKITTPQKFTADLTYDRVASAHNIVINEQTGTAYAVGANSGGDTCGGGLHMIDIRDPKKPTFLGCFQDAKTGNAGTGYSHDAQCVNYKGPDSKYKGREICFGSNETMISIADVTDRKKPIAVSRAAYPNVNYAHQGWLTEDQRFFYMNDEGDETAGVTPKTRTIMWDVSDLDDPQVAGFYLGETPAIDHNLYVKGDTMYQSNYSSGMRVIDISDRKNPKEVGFFDSVPANNDVAFTGSWSNYPYFKSGAIIFTSIREGLFIVKMKKRPIL